MTTASRRKMSSAAIVAPAAPALPALPVNVEVISRVAGLSAVAGAILAGAGMLYTYAYLSAWGIAPPLVKMDLISAALRAEGVAYQVLLFAGAFLVTRAVLRWTPRLRILRLAGLAGTGFVVVGLSADSVLGGFAGGAIALLGGVTLAVLRARERVGLRGVVITAGIVVLLSSYVTGTELGRATRDDRQWQRPVRVVTDVAMGDLGDPTTGAPSFQYEGLYLIFRDDRQLYLGVPGSDEAWLLDGEHVLSVHIAPAAWQR